MTEQEFTLEFGSVSSTGHCFATVVSDTNDDHDGRIFEILRTGRVRDGDKISGVFYSVSESGMYVGEIEVPTGEFNNKNKWFNKEINTLVAGVLSGEVLPDMFKQIKSVSYEPSKLESGAYRISIVVKQHPGVTQVVTVLGDGSWSQYSSGIEETQSTYLLLAAADGWIGWNHKAWDEYVEDLIKKHESSKEASK